MTTARTRARSALRDAVLAEAAARLAEGGWDAVRMADLAQAVGVSRQTVHNEFRTRGGLGEALVQRETEVFLDAVRTRLAQHPDDAFAGLRAALVHTFEEAADNALLHAVLTSTRGGSPGLLPLLTTRSEPLLQAAGEVLRTHLRGAGLDDADDLDVVVDAVVRLVVSHLVLPTGPPARTAEELTRLARAFLRTA